MMITEGWCRSAKERAVVFKDKSVFGVAVVESHLRRIAGLNPSLNTVTVTLVESALKKAGKADNAETRGPLHGVPFTVKENIDCKRLATTREVPSMVDSIPVRDEMIVQLMKAAGAISLATTNVLSIVSGLSPLVMCCEFPRQLCPVEPVR